MKKRAQDLQALIAMLTPFVCFIGMMALATSRAEKLISPMTFLGGMGALATTTYIAIRMVDKHWDGEEWR